MWQLSKTSQSTYEGTHVWFVSATDCRPLPGGASSWTISAETPEVVHLRFCTTPPQGDGSRQECATLEAAPRQDTDEDGLPDDWETVGVDTDGDGLVDVPLPQMGADPQHKDLFVELDWMSGHRLDEQALDRVRAAFAAAPVTNPDGRTGIALHLDSGRDSVMDPNTGKTWGAGSGASEMPHQTYLLGTSETRDYDWFEFDALKNIHLTASRRPVFRYGIAAHRLARHSSVAGIARVDPGSDFALGLSPFCPERTDCPGPNHVQAGLLMHELGHTLGLGHGGEDGINYKPNYLSVMNYAFDTGIPRGNGQLHFDFSRFDETEISELDENALDETAGIRATNEAADLESLRTCPLRGGGGWRLAPTPLNAPVDWNCDGVTNRGPIEANVTGYDGGDESLRTLRSYDDWANILLRGGEVGGFGLAAGQPQITRVEEPSARELLRGLRASLRDRRRPRVKMRRRGRTLRIVARDDRGVDRILRRVGRRTKTIRVGARPQRRMRAKIRLRRGRHVIRIRALDVAGRSSRPAVRRVRVR